MKPSRSPDSLLLDLFKLHAPTNIVWVIPHKKAKRDMCAWRRVPIMMIMEPEWTFKKAQLETMQVYKTVIPQYLLASQKLDFLCFTEGLYKISERYLPDACAEDRALW